jgi:hypothetical protein
MINAEQYNAETFERQDQAARRLQWKMQVSIAERAEKELGFDRDKRTSTLMDLESVPELDLPKLLSAPLADFGHDMRGIRRYMDRTTCPGKLTDCFWPRCCQPQ